MDANFQAGDLIPAHRECRLVIAQRIGRLGNQIYLLANLLAFHEATGIGFCHPTLGSYGQYFKGTYADPLVRYPQRPDDTLRWLPSGKLTREILYMAVRASDRSGLLNLASKGNTLKVDHKEFIDLSSREFLNSLTPSGPTVLVGGWGFRYPTISQEFLAKAREFFAPVEPFASRLAALSKAARTGTDVLIGVHLRQTDFKQHADGKYYISTDAYAGLMRHCRDLFPGKNVLFLVVSDEPKTEADFPGLKCLFGTGIPLEDMYALGFCDFVIGSIASSFSHWPAVLYQRPTYRIDDANARPKLSDFVTTIEPWQYRQ